MPARSRQQPEQEQHVRWIGVDAGAPTMLCALFGSAQLCVFLNFATHTRLVYAVVSKHRQGRVHGVGDGTGEGVSLW